MAIATVDDIAAALAVAQNVNFIKTLGAAKAAGAFQSGWRAAGKPGAAASPPAYTAGSGYTCDRATVGALGQANGSVQNWLARITAAATLPGSLIIADRLWQCAGLAFGAATYTITTPGTLPARITDSGVGCELWLENDVAAGAASGTVTASYKDTAAATHSGVLGAVVSAPVAGQMQPVPLAAGDTGISQLVSLTNSATWTSGTWGATILKRYAEIPIIAPGVIGSADWAACLRAIPADACLMLIYQASTTTAATLVGTASIIDK